MKKETTAPRPSDREKNQMKTPVPQKPETPVKTPSEKTSKEQQTWPDEVDVTKTKPTIPDIEARNQPRDQQSREQQSREQQKQQPQRTQDEEVPEEGTSTKDPKTGNWK